MQRALLRDLRNSGSVLSHFHKVAKVACACRCCEVFFEMYDNGMAQRRQVSAAVNRHSANSDNRHVFFYLFCFIFYLHLLTGSAKDLYSVYMVWYFTI